jgi:4-amino-4-deoxy-L-arabinose transferase-like glycosyltransferase
VIRLHTAEFSRTAARLEDTRIAATLLALLAVFLFFHDLGGAALLDPDEGRNAEIAREVLVTNDWVTPYYDFLPRLEKPMLFYALTALSYKVFGFSEAAARFPSAAAALGALLLTYSFARRFYGERAALWSGLVLVTSVQFNTFSRIVILDMLLAFFITLALVAYYLADTGPTHAEKRGYYFLMYTATAAATLVKGPIGFIFPGMIVFAYIAVRQKWSSLRGMGLAWGILIFLCIAAPWYLWAEARRPGYLAYFLGQEHFTRYLTSQFHRTKPWYYFFAVVAVGFLPWTFLLPAIASRLRKSMDNLSLYALLWAAVPFIFFTFSSSKMSEYLLPIYPALAILAGKTLIDALDNRALRFLLSVGWLILSASILYLGLGLLVPALLPAAMPDLLYAVPQREMIVAAFLASALALWTAWVSLGGWRQGFFPVCCLILGLTFFLAHRVIAPLSAYRSSKRLGIESAALLRPENPPTPVVIYDTSLPSLLFYLDVREPVWVVAHEGEDDIMGSFFISAEKPPPAPGYGKVIWTYEEFDREWARQKVFVFTKEKRLPNLPGATVLLRADNVALVTNR